MAQYILLPLLLLTTSSIAMAAYNILDYGAKADGRSDAAKALLTAWQAACSSRKPATITIPTGRFLVSKALLQGPCNNNAIRIFIQGTIVAPADYNVKIDTWIAFKYVEGVSIFGGTLDAQGQAYWNCKTSGRSCPPGITSFRVGISKNVLVSGLTLLNAKNFHMVIFGSNGVRVQDMKIIAPENSPNTDGIHIQKSSGVTITGSTMQTGDDCVSIGEGTSGVWIERVNCGPGHGISIGSLGGTAGEGAVQNITVTNVVFTGTQNGFRIKTWGKPNFGSVKDITYQHAVMKNVQNPIVIDQNYCPGATNCPGQSSGVRIAGVKFNDIQGSSATQVAVKFDCSQSNPCSGIGLKDIKLTSTSSKGPAQTFCKNVRGSSSGFIIPKSCI